MNTTPIKYDYDINTKQGVDLIHVEHALCNGTREIQLHLLENGMPFAVDSDSTVTASFVTADKRKVLLADDVACKVTEDGDILIPIDSAVLSPVAGKIDVEIQIVSQNRTLALPYPLWIRIRGSIVENAHIADISKGTVAEQIKAVSDVLVGKADKATKLEGYGITDGATKKYVIERIQANALKAGKNIIIENGVISSTGGEYVLTDADKQEIAKIATKGDKGDKGDSGENGKSAYQSYVDNGGTLSEKQWLASLAQGAPIFAQSVEDMTDTSKLYVMPDGHIWAYMKSNAPVEVTKTLNSGNSEFLNNTRISANDGSLKTGAANPTGFITSPYIDITEYMKNSNNVKIRLKGIEWYYGNPSTQNAGYCGAVYNSSKANLSAFYILPSTASQERNYRINTISKTEVEFTPYDVNSEIPYRYVRFSGKGTDENAVIEITYLDNALTEEMHFADTGLTYTPADYEERIVSLENQNASISEELSDVKQQVDSYGNDITQFRLANPAVYDFMTTVEYDSNDYSKSEIFSTNAQPYRADRPLPVIVKIPFDAEAVATYVLYSDQTANINNNRTAFYQKVEVPYGAQRVQIYNLIPGKTYYYKICYLYADGMQKVTDYSSFATDNSCTTRMLHIDGINNARDLGGYSCSGGKVAYGKLFRSSAFDEAAYSEYKITDKGIRELVANIGVRAELDLRSVSQTVDLGDDIDFSGVPFESYLNSINATTYGALWKTAFDFIANKIAENKPVIFHCQGGADRTGTLAAVLQGVLGVSESDINKEYELTSGFAERKRNSTSYKWSEMMTALKSYGSGTLQNNCIQFLLDCGVSQDNINSFRNSMVID